MRIAFVSLMEAGPWGGSEVLWHATALYALEQGDEVFVSVFRWEKVHHQIKLLQEKGASIFFKKRRNDTYSFWEKLLRFIKNSKPSLNPDYQSVINFRPDLVFISQGESFEFAIDHYYLYTLLRKSSIAYSIICHSHIQYSWIPPKEVYPRAVEMFTKAKRVFFVSNRQWQLTERRLACKLTNGQFTWNPVNVELPHSPLPWPQNEVAQMAIVGSFLDNKGQDTAFEVLSSPAWKERQWQLNLYGDGDGKKYLQDLALFYGIENRVVFHGHVSDVKNIWMTNELLLIPSSREGLPISLIEAMTCGRAAIATDVGGISEFVVDMETGFIAASPTTGSFSDALERAWINRDGWIKLGLKSFELINNKYHTNPEIKLYQTLRDMVKE